MTRKAKPYPVATVGALILNKKGEALFVHTHKWEFTYGIPGGKIEKGETAHAALLREIREETGLKVTADLQPILVMDSIDSREFYIPNSHFILLNYIAHAKSQRVTLNDEAESFLWMQPKEALRLKLNVPTRRLVEYYLRALKQIKLA